MKVRYKCKCFPEEVEVDVTDRRGDEDIADWMQRVVVHTLGIDHHLRSPDCREAATEYVKIPLEDGAQIGTPATRH